MKIAIVVGTRPEVIKMASVIKELQKRRRSFFIIHSNQHYSPDMDAVFFEELGLPKPDYNLNVGSGTHSNQTGNIMIRMEPILESERPDLLIAQGDTNTVLAAGLVASKLDIPVAHLEAGLRSYDKTMPEETNRVIYDHLSDYLFAVTNVQKEILLKEGIDSKKISVVGNTVVDVLLSNKDRAAQKSSLLKEHGLLDQSYFLATIHRSNNVDYKEPLQEVVTLLTEVSKTFAKPVIWPIHPRTRKKVEEFGIPIPSQIKLIGPTGYLDFIALQSQAFTILTDSGGIQEEACALKIPCVTIRENTERPETVEVGANVLVGRNVTKAIAAIEGFKKKSKNWQNPFGDGQTAVRVCDILFDEISEIRLPEELEKLKLSVVGLGYMGLPMAALLARRGFEVAGIDISESKISALKAGQCPLEEPGLPSLLKQASSKRFSFHRKPQKADVFVVAVPTPEHDKKCDLKYVVAAVESLVPFLEDGNLLIVESTIRPRTMVDVIRPIVDKSGKRVLLAHCPERAIPGKSIYELTHNDRVIGGVTLEASALAHSIYSQFIQGEIFVTDSVTAECVKLMENTYRDVNIAIANEFDQIGHELGISAREAIRLANRHPRVNILEPGIGVGGHCIAIDPWFLVESVEHAPLIKTAREVNDKRPHWVADKILAKFPKAKKIGILGVTYKPDVDDIRETPVEHIVEHLISKGADVKYFDPYYAGDFVAKFANLEELQIWADELILLVNHSKFNSLKFNKPVRRFWEL